MIGLPHALLSIPLPHLTTLAGAPLAGMTRSGLLAAALPPAGNVLSPLVILVLCVAAGIGTILALPSRREAAVRTIGGVILLAAGLILAALLVHYAADHGGGMGVYFWIFSAIAIFAALRVITHNRPVYSALYFVLTVLASAGLFVLMWAEFMAAALVLIYAGAILITYVFVIMLASQASSAAAEPLPDTPGGATAPPPSSPLAGLAQYDLVSREPIIACAVGFALMGILLFITFDQAAALPPQAAQSTTYASYSTQELGHYLFSNQLITLELAGIILTIAMVGAIVIARRNITATGEMTEQILPEVLTGPATPTNDDPHSIPVYGTRDRRQKEYPET
jgi:NADH-quinone oxidoreductase subunit J